jgi:hypothetical protein
MLIGAMGSYAAGIQLGDVAAVSVMVRNNVQ